MYGRVFIICTIYCVSHAVCTAKILFYHTEGAYNPEDWQEISEDEYNQIIDRVDDKKIAYEYMYLN